MKKGNLSCYTTPFTGKNMNKKPHYLILLGPPGSGKGTQAATLSQRLDIPHISTGDLFRFNVKNNTPIGCKAKDFIEKGQLVPDDLVVDMLFDRATQNDCANGFLLDGFPRTLAQAEIFEHHMPKESALIVINLDVEDNVIAKRAEGRLTCKECGSVYNKYFSPPKEMGKCDRCGGELFQRPDDNEEVVKERLKNYHNLSKPLIAHYEAMGVLKSINGNAPRKEVEANLLKIIEPNKP